MEIVLFFIVFSSVDSNQNSSGKFIHFCDVGCGPWTKDLLRLALLFSDVINVAQKVLCVCLIPPPIYLFPGKQGKTQKGNFFTFKAD